MGSDRWVQGRCKVGGSAGGSGSGSDGGSDGGSGSGRVVLGW